MSRLGKLAVLALLVVVGVVVYPAARSSYLRHRAERHLDQAETLKARMSSPVAIESLDAAILQVSFAMRRVDAAIAVISSADDALVALMQELQRSPPSENPVHSRTAYEPVVRAGDRCVVTVTVATDLAEAYLVRVTAEFGLDSGYRSGEQRREIEQRIARDSPVPARFEFPVPGEASGTGWVHTSVTYRLNPTGEGADLQEQVHAPLPVVTIAR
jgi:hypothetical protein